MSAQPKVSKRMENAVINFRYCVCECEWLGNKWDSPSVLRAQNALLSDIAELEQRAGEVDFFAGIVRDHYADIVMPTVEDRDAAKPSDWINCAIMELGNQHKRAEKWKEAAVAIHEAAMCARGIVLTKRVEAAFAALGGEWDEAVTANRQEAKP